VIDRWSARREQRKGMDQLLAGHTLQEVQRSSLLEQLSGSELIAVLSASRYQRVYRRDTLFKQGGHVQHVFLILKGRIKVSRLRESGAEVILRIAGPGEVIGDFGDAVHYGSTAQAMDTSELVAWDTGTFLSLTERFSAFRRNQTRILLNYLEEMQSRFCEISTYSVEQRLAHTLARLLPTIGRPTSEGIEIKMSQQELGQMIGATQFTISRLMSHWQRQGIVSRRRESILVRDPQRLKNLSESSH
jgi:CRP/FNR family transcriptional regulator, nitrogen oxide reductase regulator